VLISKHTGERAYPCEIDGCLKSYFSRSEVLSHMKKVHKEGTEECPICLKSFKNLKPHLKYHEERKFVCEFIENGQLCDSRFVNNNALQKHVDFIHQGIR
jgi:uncharacterized Zn-finger protein